VITLLIDALIRIVKIRSHGPWPIQRTDQSGPTITRANPHDFMPGHPRRRELRRTRQETGRDVPVRERGAVHQTLVVPVLTTSPRPSISDLAVPPPRPGARSGKREARPSARAHDGAGPVRRPRGDAEDGGQGRGVLLRAHAAQGHSRRGARGGAQVRGPAYPGDGARRLGRPHRYLQEGPPPAPGSPLSPAAP
jgi:hypothetical protein